MEWLQRPFCELWLMPSKKRQKNTFCEEIFFHKTHIFSLQFLMRLNLSEVAVIMIKKQSEKNNSLEKC